MADIPAITVKSLTKTFRIPLDKGQSVKNRILGKVGKGYREFTPLNDVSFTINKGDFFAIVGRNGSGKSTLLKTIAGIYQPTKGKVEVNGVLVPFIELGVGFNPSLTGRENVYLSTALLGFSRQETDAIYEDIVDFAELHDFMEERLQNYSSGMQVRLAFSIAIRAKGDILLLDEVLAVGDAAFQEKCFNYFEQLKHDKKTVILVTHSMAHVERFCNRGLLINDGKIEAIGRSDEIAQAYDSLFSAYANENAEADDNSAVHKKNLDVGAMYIKSVVVKQDGHEVSIVEADKSTFDVSLKIQLNNNLYKDFNVAIDIRNGQDVLVLSTSFGALHEKYINFVGDKTGEITFSIDNILGNGSYYINVSALGNHIETGRREKVVSSLSMVGFSVKGRVYHTGSLTYPNIHTSTDGIEVRSA